MNIKRSESCIHSPLSLGSLADKGRNFGCWAKPGCWKVKDPVRFLGGPENKQRDLRRVEGRARCRSGSSQRLGGTSSTGCSSVHSGRRGWELPTLCQGSVQGAVSGQGRVGAEFLPCAACAVVTDCRLHREETEDILWTGVTWSFRASLRTRCSHMAEWAQVLELCQGAMLSNGCGRHRF